MNLLAFVGLFIAAPADTVADSIFPAVHRSFEPVKRSFDAQAPGFLPVTCANSNWSVSDHTVKNNVKTLCRDYASSPAIPARSGSLADYYVQNGTLQYKIVNACDDDYKIHIDGCQLEFNSIAYGCTDDGRLYNGSSHYGW